MVSDIKMQSCYVFWDYGNYPIPKYLKHQEGLNLFLIKLYQIDYLLGKRLKDKKLTINIYNTDKRKLQLGDLSVKYISRPIINDIRSIYIRRHPPHVTVIISDNIHSNIFRRVIANTKLIYVSKSLNSTIDINKFIYINWSEFFRDDIVKYLIDPEITLSTEDHKYAIKNISNLDKEPLSRSTTPNTIISEISRDSVLSSPMSDTMPEPMGISRNMPDISHNMPGVISQNISNNMSYNIPNNMSRIMHADISPDPRFIGDPYIPTHISEYKYVPNNIISVPHNPEFCPQCIQQLSPPPTSYPPMYDTKTISCRFYPMNNCKYGQHCNFKHN